MLSFTIAIIAGARKPLVYVYAARITNAMMIGRCSARPVPPMPIVEITTCMPTSCKAM